MDDDILIRQIAMGNRTAFDTLYRCYAPHLRDYLYAQLGQFDVAEEVCHDVLLVVWQNAGQFQHESRFSTWVFGIASRLARKARTRALSRTTELSCPVPVVDRPSMDDPAVALEQQEQMRTLSHALTHLPDHLQETVRLRYYQGYTYQQISHALGCAGMGGTSFRRKRPRLIVDECLWCCGYYCVL